MTAVVVELVRVAWSVETRSMFGVLCVCFLRLLGLHAVCNGSIDILCSFLFSRLAGLFPPRWADRRLFLIACRVEI